MDRYQEIKFDDIETMTKEEAIHELKVFFKDHKKFTEFAIVVICTTHGFEKIHNMTSQRDNWNWEKFLSVSIDTKAGFKTFTYRKGNQTYRKSDKYPDGNETFDIDGYRSTVYYSGTEIIEEFDF